MTAPSAAMKRSQPEEFVSYCPIAGEINGSQRGKTEDQYVFEEYQALKNFLWGITGFAAHGLLCFRFK
ncbi:MAG: hypothetical protein JWQ14_1625 [Adhaeribacter sp.]|jgi:hypothetical protein|nr:hypothetical protein [Adhaeribacter sp.]